MGMMDYGVDDYGLVLNTNHLKLLAYQLCEDYSEKEWEEDASSRYVYAEKVSGKLNIEYISEFTGEALYINDDGNDRWINTDAYSCDTIYFIPIRYYPNLFKSYYTCIEDIVFELKEKIGKYLPATFDYRNNIRHIIGTYYG